MHCRYCGAANPQGEARCGKCQRRISSSDYPVIETAAAPDLSFAPAPEQTKPRLSAIYSNPSAVRQTRPTQQPLFAYREPQKVMELPGQGPARSSRTEAGSRPRQKAAPGRRSVEGQSAFDFGGTPPAQPFRKETSRRNVFPVAPLSVRAVAALIDAAIVLAFTAGLIGFTRLLLIKLAGYSLPLSMSLAPYALVAVLSVGICYKLIWCLFCQPTIGLQQVGLRVVSFSGQLPSLSQCIARILSGYLSFGSLCMGLAWAAVDDEQLTWHDHISQTYLAMDSRQ